MWAKIGFWTCTISRRERSTDAAPTEAESENLYRISGDIFGGYGDVLITQGRLDRVQVRR